MFDSREQEGGGIGLLASLLLHTILITLILIHAPSEKVVDQEPLTYVELAQALPQNRAQAPEVIEAPGPESRRPPTPNAPLSDADRSATTPRPSGSERTRRPGLTDAPYIPGSPMQGQPSETTRPTQPAATDAERRDEDSSEPSQVEGLRFEESSSRREAAAVPEVDWSSAIQEAGRVASLGGPELGTFGGEEGFAESGPISFETQWYDWGEYATSMIRRIRYHWYNNMPALVQMGVKGVVVIRFTIQRDGTITDITLLQSSGHPPFDFAARKAIELSSPLQPLPADFPKPSERVTAGFYYNLRPPGQ